MPDRQEDLTPEQDSTAYDQQVPNVLRVSLQPAALSIKRTHAGMWISLILVALLGIAGILLWLLVRTMAPAQLSTFVSPNSSSASAKPSKGAPNIGGTQLDPHKSYGDKYASGILPVGDKKYSTSNATLGSIYACSGYAQKVVTSQGGANVRGPWFINNTQYDINKKVHVAGSVAWQSSLHDTVSGSIRTIMSNDLPNHTTGIFPIASADPAYNYDRNPNTIRSQTLSYSLPASPSYSSPHCMEGEAGIMLTGVPLFNAFDAGGRDAGAWEVQDGCAGHPQISGEYHYHTLSSCIKDAGITTVIGFALDGFPITGPKVGDKNILTTADLDVCHGIVSQITLDGNTVTTYHYVMTQDFPYSISCFRANPIQTLPASGQQTTGQPGFPPTR